MNTNVGRPVSTPDNLTIFPGQLSADIDISDPEMIGYDDPEESKESGEQQKFDGNLAEDLSESDLGEMSSRLLQEVEEDIAGREKWENVFEESLKYLGVEDEELSNPPWQGSCKVVHPMMLEAITRFQSRALVKLFPPEGTAKLAIESKEGLDYKTQVALEKAQRKFNRYIQDKMPEHAAETDRLLFAEAQIGFALKKIYFHPKLGRVTTQFVKAEDFIIPYGFDNLDLCPRFTEQVRKSLDEVKTLQRQKVYRDCDITASMENLPDIEAAKAKQAGHEPGITNEDGYRLYEIYADLCIEDDEFGDKDGNSSPYVITVEQESNLILQVRRNWDQEDPLRRKINPFVPYSYVPAEGSYAYGIVHLVGQLASSVTKILRQLIDAGTLANLPAGFKATSARIKSQAPLAPGEWRDVDISVEELSKSFYNLPYKEPSQVLYTLMTLLEDAGRSFASTADLDISASSQNAPVGTTLALLERQTEVSNAVQLRLHNSYTRELNMIKNVMKQFQQEDYVAIFGELEQIAQDIYVCPVGDASSATLSQRVIQLSQVQQMAAQAPQIYDLKALHRSIISGLGITDAEIIIPDQNQIEPADPVAENMAVMTAKPIKAFDFQDHKSHIAVHTALLNDPQYQQMFAADPNAASMMAAMHAHIAEHAAFDYRQQIEKQLGVQLPPLGQPQTPQVDAALSSLMASAATQVGQQHASEVQQQQAQQQAQDPAFQLEQKDLQIKQQDVQQRGALGMKKLELDDRSRQDKKEIELLRIHAQHQQANQVHAATVDSNINAHNREQQALAVDAGKSALDNHTKKIGFFANLKAKLLGASKPSSGE